MKKINFDASWNILSFGDADVCTGHIYDGAIPCDFLHTFSLGKYIVSLVDGVPVIQEVAGWNSPEVTPIL